MVARKAPWCIDCGWLSLRVAIDGGSAYWCRAKTSRIDGPVAWKPACELYARPGATPRP